MGAWGTALYSDDTTCDVRDQFKEFVAAGLSVAEAEKAVLAGFGQSLLNHQVECLVYFALAHTQWCHGCLSTKVRARAFALLMSGGDIMYWATASAADARKRAKVLAKLSVDLLEKPRPVKAILGRPSTPIRKQLNAPLGTVFALTLPDGNLAALALVGVRPVGRIAEAVFRVLPWKGPRVPDVAPFDEVSSDGLLVYGHHEFSLHTSNARKNPTRVLIRTPCILNRSFEIDASRSSCINIDGLAEKLERVLEAF